jgi:hypothetical protein
MRTTLLARALAGSVLLFSCIAFATPPLLLEDARLVPTDGSPQGFFGNSVAIDGNVAVVGATDGAGMPEQGRPGAAYVFERQSTGVWKQVAKLLPLTEAPSGTEASNFGTSVAIEGDVIVVGCYFSPQTTVFERRDGVWTRAAVLDDTGGVDVDIQDGTIITSYVRGAHLYRRGPSGWVRVQTLENGVPLDDADYVGPAVAISSVAAIHGSYGRDNEVDPPLPGTAYIYPLGPDHLWNGQPPTALTDPEGASGADGFSSLVDISGTTALIFASPRPYVYERNSQGGWTPTQAIDGAAEIDRNTILAGPRIGEGLRVYRRSSATTWSHRATLAASTGEPTGALGLKGNRAIAGGGFQAPGAFVFTLPAQLSPNPSALIQEDFEDGVANGWVAQPNSTFTVASVGGTRVYRQTNTVSSATAIYQNADWDRQSIQADVIPRAFAASTGDRWFGLTVRYLDANNFYYLTARNSNTIDLKRMQNGVVTTLGSAPLQVALNRNYSLRLEAHADHLRAFVDGRLVISAFDTALTRGRPGITMYKTQADYDNVIVNPDPSRVLKDEHFNTPTIREDWDFADYNYQWVKLPDRTVFTQPTTGGGAYAFAGPVVESRDQIVRARMRATQFNGADRWFGLIGRYVDSQNYYYVTLRSSNQISLRKLTNGVATTLDTATTSPVTVNTWYDLRLDVVGTKLRVYLNGALKLEATDTGTPHVSSRYGVAAYKTAAEADDFLAIAP